MNRVVSQDTVVEAFLLRSRVSDICAQVPRMDEYDFRKVILLYQLCDIGIDKILEDKRVTTYISACKPGMFEAARNIGDKQVIITNRTKDHHATCLVCIMGMNEAGKKVPKAFIVIDSSDTINNYVGRSLSTPCYGEFTIMTDLLTNHIKSEFKAREWKTSTELDSE